MAISPLVVAWLSNLKSREILRGGAMLEMGPSDLILSHPRLSSFTSAGMCPQTVSALSWIDFSTVRAFSEERRSPRCTARSVT